MKRKPHFFLEELKRDTFRIYLAYCSSQCKVVGVYSRTSSGESHSFVPMCWNSSPSLAYFSEAQSSKLRKREVKTAIQLTYKFSMALTHRRCCGTTDFGALGSIELSFLPLSCPFVDSERNGMTMGDLFVLRGGPSLGTACPGCHLMGTRCSKTRETSFGLLGK